MKRKTGRVFVGTLPTVQQHIEARRRQMEQTVQHLKELTEEALRIANTLYHTNGPKPNAQHLLMFVIVTMVSLEREKDAEDVMRDMQLHREDFRTMTTILFLQWEHLGCVVPSDFPFTSQEFREAAIQEVS